MLAPVVLALFAPTVDLDQVYATVDGEKLHMDVYRPAGAPKNVPVVFLVHGGAWVAGSRRDMAAFGNGFAQRGLIAASIQYRLAPKHKWPAMLEDAEKAVRFARGKAASWGADSSRFGAVGISAGGQISLILGSQMRFKGVLDIFGPTDMSLLPQTPMIDMMVEMVLGKKRKDAAPEMSAASPINHLRRGSPPVFVIHGTKDQVVDVSHSHALEAKCRELGIPIEARYIPDLGHALPAENAQVRTAVFEGVDWLVKTLKK